MTELRDAVHDVIEEDDEFDEDDEQIDGELEVDVEYDEEEGEYEEGQGFVDEDEDLEEELDDETDLPSHSGAAYIRGLEPEGANSQGQKSHVPSDVPEWNGLHQLPEATQTAFRDLLGRLRAQSRKQLTILLLGKSAMGKSSTANSLFGEHVATVAAMVQPATTKPTLISRRAAYFTLTVIDTPGLLESDTVSEAALNSIADTIKDVDIDAVLYIDRLDMYRVEPSDRSLFEGITRVLGAEIWQHTLLGLTRAQLLNPPGGTTYESFLEKRVAGLRQAIKSAGGGNAALPVVLIENSSRCKVSDDTKEKVLPHGAAWLPTMMEQVVAVATASQYRLDPKAAQKSNPNRRGKWLIPLFLAAQIAFKFLVLDKVLDEDGVTGDQYGPYDPDFVEEARRRARKNKELRRREKARQKEAREGSKRRQRAIAQSRRDAGYDYDYDD